MSPRLAGLRRTESTAHPGSTPTPERGRGGLASLSLPLPLPFIACPSPAPYLAIPLAAPSPSLHGLGAPWLILSPALGSMNGLGSPSGCEGDQIRQGGRPGPPLLPPAAATDPVHQRSIKRPSWSQPPRARRRRSRAEPSRADPPTVSQRPALRAHFSPGPRAAPDSSPAPPPGPPGWPSAKAPAPAALRLPFFFKPTLFYLVLAYFVLGVGPRRTSQGL